MVKMKTVIVMKRWRMVMRHYLEVGQPAHDDAQLETQAFDDAAVTGEDACTEAAAFVKHPNTITIEGKQVRKSTAL